MNTAYKCGICGTMVSAPYSSYMLDEGLLLCHNCANQLHTCRGCVNREYCEVENNPLNLTPTITKVVTGPNNQTIQIQQPNPVLFETYCPNCKCFQNNICMRTIFYCANWDLHGDYAKKENEE